MHQSLRDACATIHQMPTTHLTYDHSSSDEDICKFPVERCVPRTPNDLRLDGNYLWSFWQAIRAHAPMARYATLCRVDRASAGRRVGAPLLE